VPATCDDPAFNFDRDHQLPVHVVESDSDRAVLSRNSVTKKAKSLFRGHARDAGGGPRELAFAEYCPLSPLTSPSGSASVTPGQLRPFGIVTSKAVRAD
jgi:hypothetical protein